MSKPGAALDSLVTTSTSLAYAVPQVMGIRIWRMMLAGHSPSAHDKREFSRMSEEKVEAFVESWVDMSMQSMIESQKLMMDFWQSMWMTGSKAVTHEHVADAGLRVLSSGLKPMERRASSNAKRLNKSMVKPK